MSSRDLPQQEIVESYGVNPAPGRPGSGEVYSDSDPITNIHREFVTTPAEDALILQYLRKQLGNTGPYNVASDSCRNYSNNQYDNIVKWIQNMRNPTPTPPFVLIPNFQVDRKILWIGR
jgi:hypothetical protein